MLPAKKHLFTYILTTWGGSSKSNCICSADFIIEEKQKKIQSRNGNNKQVWVFFLKELNCILYPQADRSQQRVTFCLLNSMKRQEKQPLTSGWME